MCVCFLAIADVCSLTYIFYHVSLQNNILSLTNIYETKLTIDFDSWPHVVVYWWCLFVLYAYILIFMLLYCACCFSGQD